MSALKLDAETLRWCIAFGVLPVRAAVEWADALIAANRGLEAPSVFELAVVDAAALAQATSLLSAVPGTASPPEVGQRVASILREGLRTNRLGIEHVARTMSLMLDSGLIPDDAFAARAHFADDGVDLAKAGIHGTLEVLTEEVTAELSGYTAEPLSLHPGAA